MVSLSLSLDLVNSCAASYGGIIDCGRDRETGTDGRHRRVHFTAAVELPQTVDRPAWGCVASSRGKKSSTDTSNAWILMAILNEVAKIHSTTLLPLLRLITLLCWSIAQVHPHTPRVPDRGDDLRARSCWQAPFPHSSAPSPEQEIPFVLRSHRHTKGS